MEPDRFDDVAFRFLEQPDDAPPPRRPPRRRRWALAAVASALIVGALAAGASALSGSAAGPAKAPAAAKAHRHVSYTAGGTRVYRSGHLCHRGDAGRRAKKHEDWTAYAPLD